MQIIIQIELFLIVNCFYLVIKKITVILQNMPCSWLLRLANYNVVLSLVGQV